MRYVCCAVRVRTQFCHSKKYSPTRAVSHRPVTAETRLRSRANPCGQSTIRQVYLQVIGNFPCNSTDVPHCSVLDLDYILKATIFCMLRALLVHQKGVTKLYKMTAWYISLMHVEELLGILPCRSNPAQVLRVPGGWGSQISRKWENEVVRPIYETLHPHKISWYLFLLEDESIPRP